MKIAVTYENGEVFQHFGRTESFKVFEVEDGKIISERLVTADGAGHGALAVLLGRENIEVLVCGGIGGGAMNALAQEGIEVCAGASGDAKQAVESYLKGELVSNGANCNHHEEEHSCADHGCGEHGCGEHGCGEGHGCGGCGNHKPIEGPNVGKTCRVHYRGTFNDGSQFDSSYDRGETLEFVCGAGMMIRGFDEAVAGMEVGQIVDVHLMPEEAYGPKDPNAIIELPISKLPGAEELAVGEQVYLYNSMGQPVPVTVVAKDEENITFDSNHEMAGKELNFRIELVEVK